MYLNGFENVEDIEREYQVPDALEGASVLYAIYRNENYEGHSFVLYSKDNTLYEVNGGHCSCNGLEGQWEPEETSMSDLYNRFFAPGRTNTVCENEEDQAALKQIVDGSKVNEIMFAEEKDD